MAHARPEDLKDLESLFGELRGLPRLKERSFGVFYFGSTPFLHFHIEDGHRFADLKCLDGTWARKRATRDSECLSLARAIRAKHHERMAGKTRQMTGN